MLIWVIIFNHKAESPTYIIAVTGVGIWYFANTGYRSYRARIWHNLTLTAVFVFTCLSPTDIFPSYIIHYFFVPYTIKAIPCILVWGIVWVKLMTMKSAGEELPRTLELAVA
jgi:hypothetical protein